MIARVVVAGATPVTLQTFLVSSPSELWPTYCPKSLVPMSRPLELESMEALRSSLVEMPASSR
jgi:hypothetical protein